MSGLKKTYRIKNTATGKYLTSTSFLGNAHWTLAGVLFRRPDTIYRHLDKLCHSWSMKTVGEGYRRRYYAVRGEYKKGSAELYVVEEGTSENSAGKEIQALDFIREYNSTQEPCVAGR